MGEGYQSQMLEPTVACVWVSQFGYNHEVRYCVVRHPVINKSVQVHFGLLRCGIARLGCDVPNSE